jgi:hypothetical protein
MTVSINGTSGLIFNDASVQNTSAFTGGFAFRNRIINGAMVIDQRNNGAVMTGNDATYSLDRWKNVATQSAKFTVRQTPSATESGYATRVNAGFSNYLAVTSSSAYSVLTGDYFCIRQPIEGFNIADLGWGTADAKTITLSFWVYSSLTGTFGGNLTNGTAARSYPFSYTVSSANTWTQISITIAGDTSGTWSTTNGGGLLVSFGLGAGATYSGTANTWAGTYYNQPTSTVSVVGTNGATFYITGVQLEKGSTATSFDYRPYGTELQLAQRYYYKQQATGTLSIFGSGFNNSTTLGVYLVNFPVALRTDPAALEQSGTAANYQVYYGGNVTVCSAVPSFNSGNVWGSCVLFSVASGLTTGQASLARSASTSAYLAWSAEL